jgi:hypothetical protein
MLADKRGKFSVIMRGHKSARMRIVEIVRWCNVPLRKVSQFLAYNEEKRIQCFERHGLREVMSMISAGGGTAKSGVMNVLRALSGSCFFWDDMEPPCRNKILPLS